MISEIRKYCIRFPRTTFILIALLKGFFSFKKRKKNFRRQLTVLPKGASCWVFRSVRRFGRHAGRSDQRSHAERHEGASR